MKVTLVSHASVIIESHGLRIWTDPWLRGKVFNQSWSLFPPAAFDPAVLDGIDYLWISHIHPDHFHIPSLNSLPPDFKRRVKVLFQDNHADQVFEVLEKCGYKNFQVIRHRKQTALGDQTSVYCYGVGTLDSCLGVIEPEGALFNANDARLNTADCRRVKSDIGRIHAMLSQFSLAVYNGFQPRDSHLTRGAAAVLEKIFGNHADLGAKVTIPFASLMRFSLADNRYMNAFANRPRDVWEFARRRGLGVAILFPGDAYDSSVSYDSTLPLEKYDALYETIEQFAYDTPAVVPLQSIEKAFREMVRHLREKYPVLLLRMLRTVVVKLPDLDKTVAFSIPADSFSEVGAQQPPDLIMCSQALHFCFFTPYGLQTLSSSAQHTMLRNRLNWRIHRALFALNNAHAYGRLKYMLSSDTMSFLGKRLRAAARYTDLTRARIRFPDHYHPKDRAN
ncbi:MAG TPA: MBL fold metallo-hydrolase [Candidatus Acidoferrales bacterium]|nr:MBL fold metallo-hydrolase [Candidatus Acidoferrales bacterium]